MNGVSVLNLAVVLVQAVGDQLGELQELFAGRVVHKTLESIPVERIEYVASHTCPPKSRFFERRGDTTVISRLPFMPVMRHTDDGREK